MHTLTPPTVAATVALLVSLLTGAHPLVIALCVTAALTCSAVVTSQPCP